MSTPALALPVSRGPQRQRRRRHALSRVPLQWREVQVASSPAFFARHAGKSRLAWIAAAILLVVGLHSAGVWYGNRISLVAPAKARPTTLAVELVHPPKPLPRIEPPPPPKPRREHAPPPIQQSTVVANEAPVAAPVDTVAAVVPAEPAPPPPPAPEPVKPAFGDIGYKNNPPPDYPAQAVRQRWQGTVLLRVRVLQNGAVESIEVVKSSGRKVLDDAAVHTVQRWVFAPSTRGTTPIDGFATVPIEFKLDT